jgi:hypothetical protein
MYYSRSKENLVEVMIDFVGDLPTKWRPKWEHMLEKAGRELKHSKSKLVFMCFAILPKIGISHTTRHAELDLSLAYVGENV